MSGKLIPVDVVELRPMRPQAGLFSNPGPIGVNVGNSTGTIGAFCRSPNGLFVLTCAHVLGSTGSDPLRAVPIQAWSSITQGWIPIGRTLFSVSGQGSGVHGDFGFLDAGLTTLEHPELVDRAQAATQITARSCTLGEIVRADGAAKGARQGSIVGIEQILSDFWADAVIQVMSPGTFGGDSGMLWKDANGDALAIHAFGENIGDGGGSPLTAAMFAERATMKLGVDLLSAPN
jgi:hypothetical protein